MTTWGKDVQFFLKKNKAKLCIVSNLSFNKDKNMKSNLRPRARDDHPVSCALKLILILLYFSVKAWVRENVSCISLCMFFSLCWLFIGSYESSVGSRPSVRAIFRGGAVFSPSAWSCSRFLAAFWWNRRWTPWAKKALIKSQTEELKLGSPLPPFYPTADEDIAAGCLSSLWQWLKKDSSDSNSRWLHILEWSLTILEAIAHK